MNQYQSTCFRTALRQINLNLSNTALLRIDTLVALGDLELTTSGHAGEEVGGNTEEELYYYRSCAHSVQSAAAAAVKPKPHVLVGEGKGGTRALFQYA